MRRALAEPRSSPAGNPSPDWCTICTGECRRSAVQSTGVRVNELTAIAAGGAVGALLRYWVSGHVYTLFGRGFPYGTLAVNVIGSLVMGVLSVLLVERLSTGPALRAFLLIGGLGAFTTFSTFSVETLNLMEAGHPGKALANALVSVVVCVMAAGLGVLAGRNL